MVILNYSSYTVSYIKEILIVTLEAVGNVHCAKGITSTLLSHKLTVVLKRYKCPWLRNSQGEN